MSEHKAPFLKNRAAEKRKKIPTGPSLFGRLVGLAGVLFFGSLIFAFVWLMNYSEKLTAPETASREVLVTIPQGASNADIAGILREAGVIKDPSAFLWAVKIKRTLKQNVAMKAGEQALDPSKNAWDVISTLVKGNFKYYPFTIPEGYNMADISRAVGASGLAGAEEFWALCHDKEFIKSLGVEADTLEGYLFPETYNFPKGTSAKTIAKAMVDQMRAVWNKHASAARAKGLTLNEVLTLASIVEKETGSPGERPLIAAVFFNRLKKKMKLQTDPTVIYGLRNFDGNITRKDLADPHPYNTYVIDGLPPGPIASPGEAAINAVINPSNTKHLYFVSKNDGTHHFSETLNEHNRMVARYQRGGSS
ncbi:MAG: endolytic transglycosylase MltG [Deltaproteobacteria bacterium]|jgi:UPF0755 protein|nr:endolytic transglycosylase MltG [Deltaproteobacteria bacterium]